ncbi:MAG: tetratricopeptide repeat protein [Desulfuromonadaceae bacterium]|nr:tetratricopeptide repeat protein [Desulfuromonadaceae bacterium]
MTESRKIWPLAIVTALVCMIVYLKALSCDFLNFDDHEFVLNNSYLKNFDWNLVEWAFTTIAPISGSWIPLSWLSYALDHLIWGLNPVGFHLTNILLHSVNAGLVVMIADRILRNRLSEFDPALDLKILYPAALLLAGLLFGIHPLRVESVVWITERRGVLNGVFALLSILYYLHFAEGVESGADGRKTKVPYFLSLSFLLLSFMAKPISVVIPALMLVLDWYPLQRIRRETVTRVIFEKVPFFFFAFTMTAVSIYLGGQDGGLKTGAASLPFWQKVVLSGNAIFEYIQLTIWPVGILPLRIIEDPIPSAYIVKGCAVAILFIVVCIFCERRWIAATSLCFILPILPVLAFFQMNDVAYAARYTYLPSVALSITGAVLLVRVYLAIRDGYQRYLVAGLAVSLLLFYGIVTQLQIGIWKDSGTFWSRVIEYQPYARAYFLRGLFFVDSGKFQAAIKDYTSCLDLAARERLPAGYFANIYGFRGEAFETAGQFQDAVEDFNSAIRINPHPLYFYHRGEALRRLGRIRESAEDSSRAGRAKGQMAWIDL